LGFGGPDSFVINSTNPIIRRSQPTNPDWSEVRFTVPKIIRTTAEKDVSKV
jgi:hypothetical protein